MPVGTAEKRVQTPKGILLKLMRKHELSSAMKEYNVSGKVNDMMNTCDA